jgi:TatD DNase family protein
MYIDAHSHLDKYDGTEIPQVIGEIDADQIVTLSVSMDPEAYLKSKTLAARYRWFGPSFGIHPWNARDAHRNMPALDKLIAESPMAGGIGLDYHFVTEPEKHEIQRDVSNTWSNKLSHKTRSSISTPREPRPMSIPFRGTSAQDGPYCVGTRAHFLTCTSLRRKASTLASALEMHFDPHIQAIARAVPPHLLLTETDNPGGYRWLTGTAGTPVLIKVCC